MEIVGNIKSYAWGKLGMKSAVAQLSALNDKIFFVNEQTPYAELWMGTHPSGPSIIKQSAENLAEVVPQLPYLFKVLSINKALSIQVHPDKPTAQRLHKEFPEHYPDPNHKPEVAIAITPFKALCGFRPYEEIHQFCSQLPPMTELIGEQNVRNLEMGLGDHLKECYKKLMNTKEEDTFKCIDSILRNYKPVLEKFDMLKMFETINTDFPGDIGVLSIFFLNILELQPGQAIFLGANEIHAYISGDCIECMACSDNVIRAGLTPKFKDINELIKLTNYDGRPGTLKLFEPVRLDAYAKLFAPPVNDFAVVQVLLPACKDSYKLPLRAFASIILVLQGERKMSFGDKCDILLKRGSVIYIPSSLAQRCELLKNDDTEDDFLAYIATNWCAPS